MLLAANPFDGDLLAAKAATYAGENDGNGLLAFYSGAMKSLQSASLPNREKSDRTAALRRGYVNALTSTKRYDQAQDQYVEILKSYPEDENLVRQVARFAESHGLTDKLLAYFRSAAQASPRDYRWPLVLARIETALRQYSQAIPDFEKAAYIRPDRSDILVAKADLETRLLRFAEALKTYRKLYELSYHDSRYLDTQAGLQARLGNKQEAVHLMSAAHLENNTSRPDAYFEVAGKLRSWGLLDESAAIMQSGLQFIRGRESEHQEYITEYASTLAILRRTDEALQQFGKTERGNPSGNGPRVFEIYYSPEEKARLARQLTTAKQQPFLNSADFAKAAGLLDLAAARFDSTARREPNT